MNPNTSPVWHAKLSASSAERWVSCPASVKASRDYPRRDTSYSLDGTLAHHYAARWLLTGVRPAMKDLADNLRKVVCQYVHEVKERTAGCEVIVEESLKVIASIHPDVGGTPDCIALNEKERKLEVIDLKTGTSYVSPAKNLQLIIYAIGALDAASYLRINTVQLTIIQPRSPRRDIARSVTMTRSEVDGYAKLIRDAATKVDLLVPPYGPGKWCWYCPHRPDCSARKKHIREQREQNAGSEFENE